MAERETRVMLHAEPVEFRKSADGVASIEGMGALYNTETVIAGFFREVIAPGAFAETVKADDIRVLYNHDANYVLGRNTSGTAKVTDEATGLRYTADLNPDDPSAMSVGARIKRRDVTGSSFSFIVEGDDDETWTRDDPAKLPLRTIKRAKVFDVGPVTFPAYEQTSVSARTKSKADALTTEEAANLAAASSVAAMRTQIETAKAWRK